VAARLSGEGDQKGRPYEGEGSGSDVGSGPADSTCVGRSGLGAIVVSVVIPTWRERGVVGEAVRSAREAGADEVIVADGGSDDGTVEEARGEGAVIVLGSKGRGPQMNAGAATARGDAFLFLHADTRLPHGAIDPVRRALRDSTIVGGRFDVRLDGPGFWLRLVEGMMNFRSRVTGLSTGDQAIFVRRDVFRRLGGFEAIPLFEDLRFTRRLRRAGRIVALSDRVTTSARRWLEGGTWRTIVLMWRLRAAHAMGADPVALAKRYAKRSG
jgi:rSAM/selenodomain-associated transferase 2